MLLILVSVSSGQWLLSSSASWKALFWRFGQKLKRMWKTQAAHLDEPVVARGGSQYNLLSMLVERVSWQSTDHGKERDLLEVEDCRSRETTSNKVNRLYNWPTLFLLPYFYLFNFLYKFCRTFYRGCGFLHQQFSVCHLWRVENVWNCLELKVMIQTDMIDAKHLTLGHKTQ